MRVVHEMREIINDTVNIIGTRYRNENKFSGVASGLQHLDVITDGFQKGEMIIIGARPSVGKTAFALTMARNIAKDGISCGFFSLEASRIQIGQRLLAQAASVSGTRLRNGKLKIEDFKRLQDAAGICYDVPLYIVDTPNIKVSDLCTTARMMKAKNKVQIIFIDYIGLITSKTPNAPMYEQQSAIAKALKGLARELDIPLVVLCQVNRDGEGVEPDLENLCGADFIGQVADVVIIIHNKRNARRGDGFEEKLITVVKQRNGPVGDVDVLFLPEYTKFENGDKL